MGGARTTRTHRRSRALRTYPGGGLVAERLHAHISSSGADEVIATANTFQLSERLPTYERLAAVARLSVRQASQSLV